MPFQSSSAASAATTEPAPNHGAPGVPSSAAAPTQEPIMHGSDRSAEIFAALTELTQASPVTLQAWLATAFCAVLYRHSYREHFLVDIISPAQHQHGTADEAPVQLRRCQFEADHQADGEIYARRLQQEIEAHQQSGGAAAFNDPTIVLCDGPLAEIAEKRLIHAFAQGDARVMLIVENLANKPQLSWLCKTHEDGADKGKQFDTHLHVLLDQLQKYPARALLKQNLLTNDELAQQQRFAQGESVAVDPIPLYKKVEEHARTRAVDVAAQCEGEQLTYGELNQHANALAHHLLSEGIRPGDKIAVCVHPSLHIAVAIIGLHKIGAVYVPLDPTFPAARISAILNEINPKKILVAQEQSFIPEPYLPCCIDLVALPQVEVAVNPDVPITVADISHIYFTSGTTGKPKGVVSNHGNLVHYISAAVNRYGFNERDTFIAAARFTFSISMFELMTPLALGAKVNILPRNDVLNMRRLTEEVSQATVFHFGPSLLKQLLPYIEEHYTSFTAFDGLRHVSSGGDMVPVEILESLKRIFRQAEVFVIYGSSEISCMGCTFEARRDAPLIRSKVGKPHQNTRVEIRDLHGNPVPIGVAGQVYFAGAGLVTGYLNQPELTAEKFIEKDGTRFYAIGDVGRLDKEGNIELLGRQDFQVQIRGMRIELLEIEQCLKHHPAIRDCVVVAKKLTDTADPSLVAYLVIHNDAQVDASFTEYLQKNLPDYMVPSVLVQLDSLPVNHNAKLDRSQLPHPQPGNILLAEQFTDASNDTERKLIGMFERLFGMSGIGIDHSFFELGGDSLQAVRLLSEIDKEFGQFIPIAYLPDHSTVRQLAQLLTSDEPIAGVGDVVVLKQGTTDAPLFCLYGVLLYRDLAHSLDTDRMVCGVYLQEEVALMEQGIDSDAMLEFLNVDKITERYYHAITAFQPRGPYYLAGESFGGIIALELARRLRQAGETVALVAMFDSNAPRFYESLSRWRKSAIHLKQIVRQGPGYVRREVLTKLKRKLTRAIKTSPTSAPTAITDIRTHARRLASKHYYPEVFDEPVVLFRATQRSEFEPPNTDLGWGRYLPQLTVHNVEGDHLGILNKGQVHHLTAKLQPYL